MPSGAKTTKRRNSAVQASDDINTNTLVKNQKGPGDSNQKLEKTQVEKKNEISSSACFIQVPRCQMVMNILAVLDLAGFGNYQLLSR